MKKIPVIRTVQAAYQFVFTHLGQIMGLIWVPMVLVTVIGFFVEQRYYAAAADALASNNFTRLGPPLLGMFGYFIAALLLYAMMYVPVIELARGQRKEAVLVHFNFGPLEWRLFRAMVGLLAFLLIAVLLSGFVIGAISSFAAASLALELLLALIYLALFYAIMRFVFLLPALAVHEEGPLLPRAWSLSAGNFWRILAIMVATMGPVALVAAMAELLLEGPQALLPSVASSSAMAAAQLHRMSLNMPVSEGIGFLLAPLFLGLAAGASAAALEALGKDTAEV
jgi:hypothetical protein